MLSSTCFGDHYAQHQELTIRVTAFGPDTHPSYQHLTSNQQQLESRLCSNQRYRRELLMMGIMVPETC